MHSRAAATADVTSDECKSSVVAEKIKGDRLNGGIYAGAILKK